MIVLPDASNLGLFVVAALVLLLTPGPAVLYIVTRSIDGGRRAGLVSMLGVHVGTLVHVAAAAIGLSAVLVASATAFTVVKWLGAAYLVYLGIRQWRAPAAPVTDAGADVTGTPRQLVTRGFLVNATNPKGIVFMLAVLPQFIDPALPQLPQYVVCGATLFFTDLVVMSGYTGLAARVLRLLREPHHVRWVNRFFGGLFVAAGAVLATFRRAA